MLKLKKPRDFLIQNQINAFNYFHLRFDKNYLQTKNDEYDSYLNKTNKILEKNILFIYLVMNKFNTSCYSCPLGSRKCNEREISGIQNVINTNFKIIQESFSLTVENCFEPFQYDFKLKRCKLCSAFNNSIIHDCIIKKTIIILYDCINIEKPINNATETIFVAKSPEEIQEILTDFFKEKALIYFNFFAVNFIDIKILFNRKSVCLFDEDLKIKNIIDKQNLKSLKNITLTFEAYTPNSQSLKIKILFFNKKYIKININNYLIRKF